MADTIDTGIPTNIKRPGAFHKFVFSTYGLGLIALAIRVLMVGVMSAAGTATAESPVQIFDEADADAKLGAGSESALMCRKSLAQGRLQDSFPELWACPIATPGSGTAHIKTLTVAGPATADGNLVIRIAGRTVTIGVSSGDNANTIAAALAAAIQTIKAALPITAAAASAVVSCTHVTKGENGADVIYTVVSTPTGVTVTPAVGAAGSGTSDITNALDASLDKDYDGIAVYNRKSADITDATTHTATAWGYATKRWRHVVFGDASTLSAANALSAAANNYTVIVCSYEATPSLAGEIAAAVTTYVWGKERPNANYDGGVLDLYPPPAVSVYTGAEVESALSAGTTPIVPTSDGTRSKIVRLVTTHTLTNSAPDYSTFDLCTSRTAAFMARQIDARYELEFPQELLVTDDDAPENVLKRVKDMIIGVHRDAERLLIVRDVDEFVPQIKVLPNEDVAGRLDVDDPFRVVSPLHQAAFRHHAYL
jgi:phage tail sheath gpL-like